jgi:hypothetical protein
LNNLSNTNSNSPREKASTSPETHSVVQLEGGGERYVVRFAGTHNEMAYTDYAEAFRRAEKIALCTGERVAIYMRMVVLSPSKLEGDK